MSRKNKKINKRISLDIFYNCSKISKLVNIIMKNGKKKKAERLLYNSMNYIRIKFNKNPYNIFLNCLKNSTPYVNVRKRKVGGTIFYIPIKLNSNKGIFIAIRNIIKVSRKKKGFFYINLANEIYNTSSGISESVKLRDEIHKFSESNRAFSHFI
ncbi:small ribosomal subunit protein uS7 [Candidatus Vidania fulgoroideorum]